MSICSNKTYSAPGHVPRWGRQNRARRGWSRKETSSLWSEWKIMATESSHASWRISLAAWNARWGVTQRVSIFNSFRASRFIGAVFIKTLGNCSNSIKNDFSNFLLLFPDTSGNGLEHVDFHELVSIQVRDIIVP